MKVLHEHWNKIFKKTDDKKLGWFEDNFCQTLKFFNLIPDWENSKIFVAGVGTSRIIEMLLKSNAQLVLNDFSSEAIKKLKSQYSNEMSDIHQWLCYDISLPLPAELNDIDIWFDRAVLHFLVHDSDVKQYFRNIHSAVKTGGYALFAEFSKKGSKKCAGLKVRRYDVQDLKERLTSFDLIAQEEYIYINIKGEPRPYIYALFKRSKK